MEFLTVYCQASTAAIGGCGLLLIVNRYIWPYPMELPVTTVLSVWDRMGILQAHCLSELVFKPVFLQVRADDALHIQLLPSPGAQPCAWP